MNKYLIFVDDERLPFGFLKYKFENIIVCRTYRQAIQTLDAIEDGDFVYISLDHDIQCKQTGYDIAKYIVEHQIHLCGFVVHSMNIVGRKNIEELLIHYGYHYGL